MRRLPLPSAETAPRLASLVRLPLAGVEDRALARAVVAGDEVAAAEVWRRYAPVLRSVLRRSLGPYEDVEDHVQEVFLRYFRQSAELRDFGALRSFLVGVAMHVTDHAHYDAFGDDARANYSQRRLASRRGAKWRSPERRRIVAEPKIALHRRRYRRLVASWHPGKIKDCCANCEPASRSGAANW